MLSSLKGHNTEERAKKVSKDHKEERERETTHLVESADLSEDTLLSPLHDGMVQDLLSDSVSLYLSLVGGVGSLDFGVLSSVGGLLRGRGLDSVRRGRCSRGGSRGRRNGVNNLGSVGSGSSRVVDGLRVGSLSGIHLR